MVKFNRAFFLILILPAFIHLSAQVKTDPSKELLNINMSLESSYGMVVDLLKKGANVNIYGERGTMPLLNAAAAGNMKVAGLLLERGAYTNITYDDGT